MLTSWGAIFKTSLPACSKRFVVCTVHSCVKLCMDLRLYSQQRHFCKVLSGTIAAHLRSEAHMETTNEYHKQHQLCISKLTLPIADKTRQGLCSGKDVTIFATSSIRSEVATDDPPNFITTVICSARIQA